MMKNIILFLLAVNPLFTSAQVTISSQVPPAGLITKDYLWNLIITNNKESVTEISIRMNVQDPLSGEILMSANSGNLSLGIGVKVVTSRDVQPVQYSYSNQNFSRTYLPLGSYVVCYQVYFGEAVLSEDCLKINIDPLSPPLLSTPTDKSVIETPYPQFTWMPPTTIDMFSDLNYDLLVTEVDEGQSPVDAIQYNAPVYSRTGISQSFESYSSGFTALQPGKTYAWQIIAHNGLNYAAKTEVWIFQITKPEQPIDIVAVTPFVQLKKINPEKGIAPNGVLKIAYYNRTSENKINIEIVDLSEVETNKKPAQFEVNILPGLNNIEYNLRNIMKTEEDKVYLARLTNVDQETWSVKFIVKSYK